VGAGLTGNARRNRAEATRTQRHGLPTFGVAARREAFQTSPQPSQRPSAESVEQWKRNWTGITLAAGFFRIEDEKNADFKNSFDQALRSYARDADPVRPNPYPRECWPSAEDFRAILHGAGRHAEESGGRLLARVPDPVLRLFAEIEFAAGAGGLTHIGSITREQLWSS